MECLLRVLGAHRICPIPQGLPELLTIITRQVLINQPEDVLTFISELLQQLLYQRDGTLLRDYQGSMTRTPSYGEWGENEYDGRRQWYEAFLRPEDSGFIFDENVEDEGEDDNCYLDDILFHKPAGVCNDRKRDRQSLLELNSCFGGNK